VIGRAVDDPGARHPLTVFIPDIAVSESKILNVRQRLMPEGGGATSAAADPTNDGPG